MKKAHTKPLHKQTFEEQMLAEFRQFSNEVMSRLSVQNKCLYNQYQYKDQHTLPF